MKTSPFLHATLALAIAAGLSLSLDAHAEARISPDLQQRLTSSGTHEVIVTFTDRNQIARLANMTATTLVLKELPMAGAILTSAQVNTVASWAGVESIYFNAPLKYLNYEAGEITGGHQVQDQIGLKGNGITVAVLDSGIDTRHPDLTLGSKTIQNVKIVGDLGLAGNVAYLENQVNTDTTSGHGTHVAGTVGGTGAASATDKRRANYYAGIAPEVSLVGLGTGEGLSILFALEGFDYALANQNKYSIDVITNSWGSAGGEFDPGNPINKASYESYRRGMVVTFAAGNDGGNNTEDTLNRYSIVPWVVNVGSGTKQSDLSGFSSKGVAGHFYKHVDVVAPGTNICSTRAPGTAVGALGPVVNATYPSYTAYYHCISGTSMATPFTAGTTALLLEANPQLSPDQIEQILMSTATPMPYPYHWVGGGYINVLAAVDLASRTPGYRSTFLKGTTKWSSQGRWNVAASTSTLVSYIGPWQTVVAPSYGGSYRKATLSTTSVPRVRYAFQGRATQIQYPRNSNGGLADVYVDGVKRGEINFFSATQNYSGNFPVANLPDGLHQVELRATKGTVYFDGALVDGKLFPASTKLVDATQTFTGTMGPSVEGLETDIFTIQVGTDVTKIKAKLGWTGGVDIDFTLVSPDGKEVASGASLANPEFLEFAVIKPGTYTYRVKGYATVLATYTLTSTQTKAIPQ